MKLQHIFALFAIVSLVLFGCTSQTQTASEGIKQADGSMIKPDGTVVKPDGTMVKADGTMIKPDGTMVKPDGTMVKPDGAVAQAEGTVTQSEAPQAAAGSSLTGTFAAAGKVLAGTTSPYIDFNRADYEKALAENRVILLYFYANWCSICRAEQPQTFAAFNQLSNPAVVGFRVNYKDSDTDTDEVALAQQFGITYQHTKVIIKNGQRVLKAPDSWDKQRYLSEIAKYA